MLKRFYSSNGDVGNNSDFTLRSKHTLFLKDPFLKDRILNILKVLPTNQLYDIKLYDYSMFPPIKYNLLNIIYEAKLVKDLDKFVGEFLNRLELHLYDLYENNPNLYPNLDLYMELEVWETEAGNEPVLKYIYTERGTRGGGFYYILWKRGVY